jgi:hypothetical protein
MLDLSLLALSMGCWLIIRMLPGLVNPDRMGALFSDLIVSKCTPMYMYLQAFLHVFYGVAVLYTVYRSETDYEIIMAVFGWISLMAGALILYFPGYIGGMNTRLRSLSPHLRRVMCLGYILILGGGLVYLGLAVY